MKTLHHQFIVAIFCLFPFILGAQTQWERTYGAWGIDKAEAVIPTADSGYLVVGSTSSFHFQSQVYILKLDKNGELIWTKNYGGEGVETAYDVVETPDRGYAVVGITNSYGNGYQGYFLRLNKTGDTLYTKTYGGANWEFLYSLTLLPDSGFALVGETYSQGVGKNDAYLIRLNKHGDTVYTKTYGGAEEDYLKKVILSIDNELIAVGGTKSFASGDEQGYLVKIDLAGNLLFEKDFGNTNNDYFTSLIEKANKRIIITGTSQRQNADLDYDSWLLTTDNLGNFIAETFFVDITPGFYNQQAAAITQYFGTDSITVAFWEDDVNAGITPVGNIIDVSGTYALTSGFRFHKSVSSFDEVFVTDVDTTLDGGFIYACYGNGRIGANGEKSIYIIKTNAQNQSGCGDLDLSCVSHKYDLSAGFASIEEETINTFGLYPNPVVKGNTLTFSGNVNISSVAIYSVSGELVQQVVTYNGVNSKISLNNAVTPGVYIIVGSEKNGLPLVKQQLVVMP